MHIANLLAEQLRHSPGEEKAISHIDESVHHACRDAEALTEARKCLLYDQVRIKPSMVTVSDVDEVNYFLMLCTLL